MGAPVTPAPTEAAPAYGDLYAQGPSNAITGYSRVPVEDIESQAHQHEHLDNIVPGQTQNQSHVHCESCDRQLDRRERREESRRVCEIVSWTFILIALFLMIFGIVLVKSRKHKE
ncbi:hypothetical protein N7495_005574 [Penicillium taxi]|uniref:uncharacterized protein n=1 Tax=Penicillium taxi TaxID=168475 RepID=UPI002545747C|nr:uncharacterized protein N7495_005574 [Penicillium taxi]KAJ5893883.1 hypothetical protein N7495_005574 [Penicillium taxi]